MANQQIEVLRALSSKEEGVGPSVLAAELRTGEANVRTYLNRLKKKGYVDGAGSSWFINDAGRKALETGEAIPVTAEDTGQDELSRFQYFGSLAGVEPNLITACSELFQNLDMRSMDDFDRVMAEQNIPQTNRNRWRSNYLGYLRNTTPPAERDKTYPLPKVQPVTAKPEGEPGSGSGTSGGETLDYVVEGTEIHRVAEGYGDFTFSQALKVVMAKRGTTSVGAGGSSLKDLADALRTLNPAQPITVKDLLDLADRLKPQGGGGGNPAQDGYIDQEGNWQPLLPGQRVVIIKKEAPPTSGKTVIVKQTPEGIVTEEHEAGRPIIIQTAPPPAGGSSMLPMTPFPVIGSDGKPMVDQDGHPVYANIEPMIRWLGFQAEQRRADERHQGLMGLVQTVRENVPDGVQALVRAFEEAKTKGGTGTPKQEASPQVYECGACKTRFTLPATEDWVQAKCPKCSHIWSREEVMKA